LVVLFFGKGIPFTTWLGLGFIIVGALIYSVRNQSVTDIERQLFRAFYLNPKSSRMKSFTPSGPVRWSHTAPFCRSQRTSNPKNGQHCRSNSTHATNDNVRLDALRTMPQLLEQKNYQQELKPLLVRSISSLIPSLTEVEILRRQLMLDIQTLVETDESYRKTAEAIRFGPKLEFYQ
jgi:hypothetical protein